MSKVRFEFETKSKFDAYQEIEASIQKGVKTIKACADAGVRDVRAYLGWKERIEGEDGERFSESLKKERIILNRESLEEKIQEVSLAHPHLGADKLSALLKEDGIEITHTQIAHILRKHGLNKLGNRTVENQGDLTHYTVKWLNEKDRDQAVQDKVLKNYKDGGVNISAAFRKEGIEFPQRAVDHALVRLGLSNLDNRRKFAKEQGVDVDTIVPKNIKEGTLPLKAKWKTPAAFEKFLKEYAVERPYDGVTLIGRYIAEKFDVKVSIAHMHNTLCRLGLEHQEDRIKYSQKIKGKTTGTAAQDPIDVDASKDDVVELDKDQEVMEIHSDTDSLPDMESYFGEIDEEERDENQAPVSSEKPRKRARIVEESSDLTCKERVIVTKYEVYLEIEKRLKNGESLESAQKNTGGCNKVTYKRWTEGLSGDDKEAFKADLQNNKLVTDEDKLSKMIREVATDPEFCKLSPIKIAEEVSNRYNIDLSHTMLNHFLGKMGLTRAENRAKGNIEPAKLIDYKKKWPNPKDREEAVLEMVRQDYKRGVVVMETKFRENNIEFPSAAINRILSNFKLEDKESRRIYAESGSKVNKTGPNRYDNSYQVKWGTFDELKKYIQEYVKNNPESSAKSIVKHIKQEWNVKVGKGTVGKALDELGLSRLEDRIKFAGKNIESSEELDTTWLDDLPAVTEETDAAQSQEASEHAQTIQVEKVVDPIYYMDDAHAAVEDIVDHDESEAEDLAARRKPRKRRIVVDESDIEFDIDQAPIAEDGPAEVEDTIDHEESELEDLAERRKTRNRRILVDESDIELDQAPIAEDGLAAVEDIVEHGESEPEDLTARRKTRKRAKITEKSDEITCKEKVIATKYEIYLEIKKRLEKGESLESACKNTGINYIKTYDRWKKGLAGEDKKAFKQDLQTTKMITNEAKLEEIVRKVATDREHYKLPREKMIDEINNRYDIDISPSTLTNFLRKMGLNTSKDRARSIVDSTKMVDYKNKWPNQKDREEAVLEMVRQDYKAGAVALESKFKKEKIIFPYSVIHCILENYNLTDKEARKSYVESGHELSRKNDNKAKKGYKVQWETFDELKEYVGEYAKRNPREGALSISQNIKKEFGVDVNIRTIRKALEQLGLRFAQDRINSVAENSELSDTDHDLQEVEQQNISASEKSKKRSRVAEELDEDRSDSEEIINCTKKWPNPKDREEAVLEMVRKNYRLGSAFMASKFRQNGINFPPSSINRIFSKFGITSEEARKSYVESGEFSKKIEETPKNNYQAKWGSFDELKEYIAEYVKTNPIHGSVSIAKHIINTFNIKIGNMTVEKALSELGLKLIKDRMEFAKRSAELSGSNIEFDEAQLDVINFALFEPNEEQAAEVEESSMDDTPAVREESLDSAEAMQVSNIDQDREVPEMTDTLDWMDDAPVVMEGDVNQAPVAQESNVEQAPMMEDTPSIAENIVSNDGRAFDNSANKENTGGFLALLAETAATQKVQGGFLDLLADRAVHARRRKPRDETWVGRLRDSNTEGKNR